MGNKFSSPGMIWDFGSRCWITKGTFFFILFAHCEFDRSFNFFFRVWREMKSVIVELKKSKGNCKLKLFRATFQVDSWGTEK